MFNLGFRFTEQFFVALILTTLTVLTHSVGMSLVQRYFKHCNSRMKDHKPFRSYRILMADIVAIMMATHFLEVIIWALFYVLRGLLPNAMSAMYFSIYSYTMLGASNITLSDHWRGIGGFEANGLDANVRMVDGSARSDSSEAPQLGYLISDRSH